MHSILKLGIGLDDRKVGNSQYDPRCMLKAPCIWLFLWSRSSRKLEREVHNNLSFIWLMKQLKPDHKTIAEFRRKNKKALKKALRPAHRDDQRTVAGLHLEERKVPIG